MVSLFYKNIKRGTILAGFAILGLNLTACGNKNNSPAANNPPQKTKLEQGDLQNDYHISTYHNFKSYSDSKSFTGASANANTFFNKFYEARQAGVSTTQTWADIIGNAGATITDFTAGYVSGTGLVTPAMFYADSLSIKKNGVGTGSSFGDYANEITPVAGVYFSTPGGIQFTVTFKVNLYKDIESFNSNTNPNTLQSDILISIINAGNDDDNHWKLSNYYYSTTNNEGFTGNSGTAALHQIFNYEASNHGVIAYRSRFAINLIALANGINPGATTGGLTAQPTAIQFGYQTPFEYLNPLTSTVTYIASLKMVGINQSASSEVENKFSGLPPTDSIRLIMNFSENSFTGKTFEKGITFATGTINKSNNEFYTADVKSTTVGTPVTTPAKGQNDNVLWGRFFGPNAEVIGGFLRYNTNGGGTGTLINLGSFMGTQKTP